MLIEQMLQPVVLHLNYMDSVVLLQNMFIRLVMGMNGILMKNMKSILKETIMQFKCHIIYFQAMNILLFSIP